MNNIQNLDFFSVGVAIAAMTILGFMVLFSNRKSVTNRSFFYLAIMIVVWSTLNYLNYQTNDPVGVLWTLRFVMFSAVWFAFYVFRLFYVFPSPNATFSRTYKVILVPITILTSLITLTPYVLSRVKELRPIGDVSVLDVASGIILFGLVVLYLDFGGIFLLIKKAKKASSSERRQYIFVLTGLAITLVTIIIFNFFLPAFFENPQFIPLSAVFVLPFIAFTAYAIFKHHLLNVKIIATEILAFILAVVSLFEVIISKGLGTMVFRSGVFALVLGFGILLIKSVLKEVEQREQLQKLSEDLKAANVKLEELSHFKSQLLSLASHQVKAPLGVIKGFATILSDGLYGEVNGKIKETLGKIRFSADELISLINNLLDLRKVEEGKMEYKFAKADLLKMAQGVIEELRPLATNKGLELSFTTGLTEAFVNADEIKLKQVIQNLVDNAIKYTPSGFVKVELKAENNELIVSVVDSGLGIPADLLPQLFEEFIRDERVKKEIRGTGLGLFIARKIVEAHSGKLSVQSEGEGKGSTFMVTLPQAK